MIDLRVAAAASMMLVLAELPALEAQAPFRYREYALESSVATVMAVSRIGNNGPKTLHDRPASIQEVVWRAPYMGLGGEQLADPVEEVRFAFYDNQLYQIVVSYDRGRTAGLTNGDVIDTLSSTYGAPLLQDARAARNEAGDGTVVAHWADAGSLLTLQRSTYSSQFQLVLISKALSARARAAIVEARRLDALEAPQRELDRRTQATAAATAAGEKARTANKAAFRP